MRANSDGQSRHVAQLCNQTAGYPDLRRCAAPEQVTRRSRDDREIGLKAANRAVDPILGQVVELAIDDAGFMSTGVEQSFQITVFERQMRLAASEVNAPVETPVGIDQRNLHADSLS